MLRYTSLSLLALCSTVASCTDQIALGYQQCGGMGHSGPTVCEQGYHCEKLNDYFSQCLPGHGTSISSPTRTRTRPTQPPITPWHRVDDNDRRRIPEALAGDANLVPLTEGSRSGALRAARSSIQDMGPAQTIAPDLYSVAGLELGTLDQTAKELLMKSWMGGSRY